MTDIHSLALAEALLTPLGRTMRGDGPPYWREGPNNDPQMSASEARRLRRNLVRALLFYTSTIDRAEELAGRIEACSWSHPCSSGGCPVCWRALQRLVVHASWRLFREDGRYEYVTCICAEDMVPQGRLADAMPLAAAERRLMMIAQKTSTRIFGGLDLSANEHQHRLFAPHYMPHPHVLVPAEAFAQHQDAWMSQYQPHPLVRVPVRPELYDGRRRAITYGLRPIVERRDSLSPHTTADGTHKRADTRGGKPLRRPQRVELALMLDHAGIQARIMMYGYELQTDGHDVWMVTVERARADELLAKRRQFDDAREVARQQRIRSAQRQPTRFRL